MTDNQKVAIQQVLNRTLDHLNVKEITYSIYSENGLVIMDIDNKKYKIKPDGLVVKI
jgi:hypothetical protein